MWPAVKLRPYGHTASNTDIRSPGHLQIYFNTEIEKARSSYVRDYWRFQFGEHRETTPIWRSKSKLQHSNTATNLPTYQHTNLATYPTTEPSFVTEQHGIAAHFARRCFRL